MTADADAHRAELKAARQSGKSGIGILDRLMLEAARLTAERDLLEKAFIDVFDEFFDSIAFVRCFTLSRQQALHELRDKFKNGSR